MENGTKALIISGAILIVIIIIGIGLSIISTADPAREKVEESTVSVEIRTYNQKFESCLGKQKGSKIRDMIADAIAIESTIRITKNGVEYQEGTSKTLKDLFDSIQPNKQYEVDAIGYDTNRKVEALNIK